MTRFMIAASLMAGLAFCASSAAADGEQAHDEMVPPGTRPFAVLKRFPVEPDFYCAEAAELFSKGIVEKHGQEEWAAVVMTHELHQHVGIYTVLGAKMGVRAREVLNAPTRAVHVTAETGPEPPISCAIDGIQASLGSTLAQKLIDVPKVTEPRVAATFEYKGRRIRLSLQPEYQRKVTGMIKAAIEEHGNLTPAYFHEIEDRCFNVWADFDRHKIFSMDELSPSFPIADK